MFVWIWFALFLDFFAIAAQELFIPSFLLLFPLNFLCGPRCSCALIFLFCLLHFAFLLAQFHLEDFRALFLVITIILNHEPTFQCLSSFNSLALFSRLLAAFPSPSSSIPHSPLVLQWFESPLLFQFVMQVDSVLPVKSGLCFSGAHLNVSTREVSRFLESSLFPLTSTPKRKKIFKITQVILDKSLQYVSYQLTNLYLIINWGLHNRFWQSF